MSLDNVLAVAAIADGDTVLLVGGLGLAILLMIFAATLIMKLLARYPWISWLGLIVLVYVAGEMMYRGIFDATLPEPSTTELASTEFGGCLLNDAPVVIETLVDCRSDACVGRKDYYGTVSNQ